jgi:hypothetical protein
MAMLTRETILTALRAALEPLDYVHAMWEGGAAAFDRVDAWSDVDLMVDADDERAGDVLAATERTLVGLSPIRLKHELPQPTWHGHAQTFYQLRDTSAFLTIDFVVLKHSSPRKFLEPEIHGRARVHFDKAGLVRSVAPVDAEALARQLRDRLETLRVTFELFQPLVIKELNRRNHVEAAAFYQGFTLRPLLEALRIRHCPARHNFHTRYVYYDLPAEVVQALEPLFFPASPDDLARKREQAERWFHEVVGATLA